MQTPEQTAVMLCELLCPTDRDDETILNDLLAVRTLVTEHMDVLLDELDFAGTVAACNIEDAKAEARREGGVPERYGVVRGVTTRELD